MKNTYVSIPTLVRIKPGAFDRVGVYAKRNSFTKVALCYNHNLDLTIVEKIKQAMCAEKIEVSHQFKVRNASFEEAQELFLDLNPSVNAIFGFGGGKALDIAKYIAFLGQTPYIAMPTALSNDAFCSPQASLEFKGKKRAFPTSIPHGVIIDTQVCLSAPKILWLSGIGDLISKITAIFDWKLANKVAGTQVDDFAALLSDATVFQFLARPNYDLESMRLLGTSLMLNGIAMAICGSSRPASGSEHLISHALDQISKKTRLHGLQVGVATYIISQIQGQDSGRISRLLSETKFFEAIREDPFSKEDWVNAFKTAPTIKNDFYTILSQRDYSKELTKIIDTDPNLIGLFV